MSVLYLKNELPFRKNTLVVHYKDQTVSGAWGSNLCLFYNIHIAHNQLVGRVQSF